MSQHGGGPREVSAWAHVPRDLCVPQGDRVVLGGEHYFRFSHPAEAQSGKRPAGEGPKDFEFARNELLAAQRSQ